MAGDRIVAMSVPSASVPAADGPIDDCGKFSHALRSIVRKRRPSKRMGREPSINSAPDVSNPSIVASIAKTRRLPPCQRIGRRK
jgi:hypothetical protein